MNPTESIGFLKSLKRYLYVEHQAVVHPSRLLMEIKMTLRIAAHSSRLGLAGLALSGLLLSGCAGMDNTEQRVLSGAAIGAGAGAGLGAVTGGLSIPAGAIIGAGAGAVTGLAVDVLKKQP
jgi:hypothetical protein